NKASVDMEVAARDGKFVKNENPRVSDTEDMLRELGVLPEGKLQTAEVTEKSPSKRQVEAHEANGGSTFTPAGEDLAGKNLYAVGAHPDRTVQVDKLTPRVLDKFKADNADLLADGKHSIGTWKDPETGKSVLDVSQLHNDREGAIAAGKAANQKSIYHLGGEGEIQTGGTGEAPAVETPYEEAQRPERVAEIRSRMQANLRAGKNQYEG